MEITNSSNAAPAWSGLSNIHCSTLMNVSACAWVGASMNRSMYFWCDSRNGISDRNNWFRASPGTFPLATQAGTSMCRTHFDSRSSGVWKSTGVTIVTRLRTRSG